MTETHRIIGNLEKGLEGLEESVAEIRADVKKLLAAHSYSRGMTYAISAFVGGLASIFTTIMK